MDPHHRILSDALINVYFIRLKRQGNNFITFGNFFIIGRLFRIIFHFFRTLSDGLNNYSTAPTCPCGVHVNSVIDQNTCLIWKVNFWLILENTFCKGSSENSMLILMYLLLLFLSYNFFANHKKRQISMIHYGF